MVIQKCHLFAFLIPLFNRLTDFIKNEGVTALSTVALGEEWWNA